MAFIGLSIRKSSKRATRGAEGSKGHDIHRSTYGDAIGVREVAGRGGVQASPTGSNCRMAITSTPRRMRSTCGVTRGEGWELAECRWVRRRVCRKASGTDASKSLASGDGASTLTCTRMSRQCIWVYCNYILYVRIRLFFNVSRKQRHWNSLECAA